MATQAGFNQLPANPYIDFSFPKGGGVGNANQAAKNIYSWYPQMMQAMQQQYQQAQPGSLAEQYKQYLAGSPELEQMQYNQALARLKGQMGTGTQQLMTAAGARRGGGEGGFMLGGLEDLNRQYMGGVRDIATTQAMNELAQREQREQNYLNYMQGDINNQQGWLGNMFGNLQGAMGGYGGFLGQQQQNQVAQGQLGLANRTLQEQINQNQINNMGSWMDRLMALQGQQGNQFYQGQNDWLNYGANRAGNILQGYTPQWLQPYSW
jgi:hypothetical protein